MYLDSLRSHSDPRPHPALVDAVTEPHSEMSSTDSSGSDKLSDPTGVNSDIHVVVDMGDVSVYLQSSTVSYAIPGITAILL